jgi:hypothetical protein
MNAYLIRTLRARFDGNAIIASLPDATLLASYDLFRCYVSDLNNGAWQIFPTFCALGIHNRAAIWKHLHIHN